MASKKKKLKGASPKNTTPIDNSKTGLAIKEHKPGCSEEELREAVLAYPELIGITALVLKVSEIANQSNGSQIWLSESSMLAASIHPASIVSVSLASTKCKSAFPLCSLSDECAKSFGIDCSGRIVNYAGNYFALATVFPSCKVFKDDVRLSSNLSSTLGCPVPGRFVFVYPIESESMIKTDGDDKLHGSSVTNISLSKCEELYLELVSSSGGSTEEPKYGDTAISSPRTPLNNHLKLGFSDTSQFSSPRHEEVTSNSTKPLGKSLDSFDLLEVLEDESARKLLESCATSWLSSRSLLYGNFVTIPMLSKLCVFQVYNGNKLSTSGTNHGPTVAQNGGLFSTTSSNKVHQKECAFTVNYATKVHLLSSPNSSLQTPSRSTSRCVKFERKDYGVDGGNDLLKLGGLSKEYAILQDILVSSAVKDTLLSMGLRPTKGVLLHGPPGTGKTSLIRKCIQDSGVNLFTVNGPEIVSQYHGESEQALHEIFDSASQATPAVVFIDELDSIAPARRDGGEELSQRMVATLLNLMDGISRTDGVLVIAATNRPESIEPALRRPGRLDREIEIGVPSPKQRQDILLSLLCGIDHDLIDIEIQQLAMVTHGFVGADLAALCNEAALVCLRRYVDSRRSCDGFYLNQTSDLFDSVCTETIDTSFSNDTLQKVVSDTRSSSSPGTKLPISSEISNGTIVVVNGSSTSRTILKVTFEDFEMAKLKVRPSAMREVILEVPKVNWEDVGGQKEVKMQLMEAVEWPQKHQDAFKRIGTRPPSGILLFGPPGCSKTLLARAVASEAGLNFLAVKGPELFSKWVGESEKAVKSLFAKARANSPSIIFFDEIDGLAVIRGKESDGVSVSDRVMSQLLVELDGLQQRANVTVIAATNRPDKIDSALLRPGRFDRLLYVGPPSETDREDIFRIHLQKIPCSPDICINQLAILTEGCTGADVSLICREAALAAIEENLDASEIRMDHLTAAIDQVQPSEIESFEELSVKFQRLVLSSAKLDGPSDQQCRKGTNQSHFWTRWIPSSFR